MRKFYTLVLSLFTVLSVNAQTQGIAYPAVGRGATTPFVTDYHCLGINSSALGWGTGYEDKHFTFGTSEFGFGIYSDSLNVERLRKLYGTVKNSALGKNNEDSWAEQRQYAKDYANAGVNINADYNWFGFSFQNEKLGGLAVSVTESYRWNSRIGDEASQILFDGKFASYFDTLTLVFGSDTSRVANYEGMSQDSLLAVIEGTISNPLLISKITKGTAIKAQWNRYYNFGYGRKLLGKDSVFVLFGGVGGRFIQSVGMFDMQSDGTTLRMYSSMSPSFDIDYSTSAQNGGSYFGTNQGGFPPKAVGSGYGFDLSLSAKIFEKITVAASVNNIGQVKYKRNVYSLKDTLLGSYRLDGLGDYDITQGINLLLKDGGLFNLEGEEEYVVKNASDFRFGASWKLNKFVHLGFDVVAPFDKDNPGSIANPVYAFGGEFRPLEWLSLNAGYFGGGIYKNNIPMGINFILGKGTYEFGVSSRDVLSFVMDNSNSVSFAMGFLRFRF